MKKREKPLRPAWDGPQVYFLPSKRFLIFPLLGELVTGAVRMGLLPGHATVLTAKFNQ